MFAAEDAPLPELVPILTAMLQATASQTLHDELAQAVTTLIPERDALTPADLAALMAAWVEALCQAPQGTRLGACESLSNLVADVAAQIAGGRTVSAKEVLDAFAGRADAGYLEGALTDGERRLLADNARYLAGRL